SDPRSSTARPPSISRGSDKSRHLESQRRRRSIEHPAKKPMVGMARQADILDSSRVEQRLQFGDAIVDRILRTEAERRGGLFAGYTVVAVVLELQLSALDLKIGELPFQVIGQVGDPHVYGMEIEDSGVAAIESLNDGLGYVSDVEQRPILVPAEHTDLPIDVCLRGEHVDREIHAEPRKVIRDAEQRSQAEGDRVLVGQVPFGGELRMRVERERVGRCRLVE